MSEAPDKAGYIIELLQVGAVVNSVDKGFFAFLPMNSATVLLAKSINSSIRLLASVGVLK